MVRSLVRSVFSASRTPVIGASALTLLLACGGREEPEFRPRRAADGEHAVNGETPTSHETERADIARAPEREVANPMDRVLPTAEAQAAPATEIPVPPELANPAALTGRAPAQYRVELDTTKGPVVIEVTRAWAPQGADRFYNLVRAGYYTDVRFFRVISGFMAQTGIHGNPAVNSVWRDANFPDDPVVEHNTRGMVSFATAGPNTRTTQFFISFGDNSRLDGMGFAPFGRIVDMTNVDRLYSEYGEGAPSGRGPSQSRMQREGNAYLRASFPELDVIRSARVL